MTFKRYPNARESDRLAGWVRQKAGLNREILSAALGMAHRMLSYKAVEAGTRLYLANTRQLKPSQRCAGCWAIDPKTLARQRAKSKSMTRETPATTEKV